MNSKTNQILVEYTMSADETRNFHRQCRMLKEPEIDEDTWYRTQIVSRTALSQLIRVTIRDLVLDVQNAGKWVLVRVLEEGYSREEGSWFNVVEDEEGEVVGLVLYNYPSDLVFLPGTVLIIKEPYCKYKMEVPFIRCDCPTDILVVPPSDPLANDTPWRNGIDYEDPFSSDPLRFSSIEWQMRGDHFRERNQMVLARKSYFIGLNVSKENDPIIERILLNLLDVNFALGYYECVVEEAKKLPNEEQALLIMGKAYYALRRYIDAISTFYNLTNKFKCSKISVHELKLIEERMEQFQNIMNISKLRKLAEENPHQEIDCADFNVPMEVILIEGKGRSIILKSHVRKGDILMVAKTIVATLDCDEFRNAHEARRDESEKNKLKAEMKAIDDGRLHRTRVVSKLTELVLKNPSVFGSLVFNLYSKKYDGEPVQLFCDSEAKTERVCDVDRINDVFAYNGFALMDGKSKLVKGYGIFHLPSFLNHSCEPNVDYEFHNDVMVVWALEDLTPGTELTLNYGFPEMKYRERTDYLKERGYICNCWKCENRI